MNFKKTALASAIALAVGGGSVLAETSTKSGQFILDKTEITAGSQGIVNLALLGLNADDEVDRYGEKEGSVIMAVVTSEKGTVVGGTSHPGRTPEATDNDGKALPYGGAFAAEVKYVRLNQGVGAVHITYDPKVIGTSAITDSITVKLQERIPTDNGGVTFTDIGTEVVKSVVVNPPSIDPKALRIISFIPSPADSFGEASTVSMDVMEGIQGSMMAGVEGGQVTVQAANPNATGGITLTLRSVKGTQEYSFQEDMIDGISIVTLDASVESTGSGMPTGQYYIEATFEGFDGDSIQLIHPDLLTVHSTGEVRKVAVRADRERISKRVNAEQGASVSASVLDQYGNPTTADQDYEIALTDSSAVVSDSAVRLSILKDTSWSKASSADAIYGNTADEVSKIGVASIVGMAVDKQNNPIGAVAESDPMTLKVVSDSLFAKVVSPFNIAQLAGAEFDAFEVTVLDGEGNPRLSDTGTYDPGAVRITNTSTKEDLEVNRSSDGKDIIKGLFKKSTSGDVYLLSDKAGLFAEVKIQAAPITVAAATEVKMRNAHGNVVTSVASKETADEKSYEASIPEIALKMLDSFGNAVTGSPVTKEITGEVRGTTANGKVSYNTPENAYGVPGRTDANSNGDKTDDNIVAKYAMSGATAFAGEDSINLTFTKPGLGSDSLVVSTTVPKLQELGSINTYIETNSIPVNSVVAYTVETLDKDGKLFDKEKTVITVTVNGKDGDDIDPTIRELDTGKIITSGQSVEFASGNGRKVFVVEAGPRTGQFSISFNEAKNAVEEASRTFTVTTPTVIDPTADAKEKCDAAGDRWDSAGGECDVVPISGTEGKASMVDAEGNITEIDTAAIFKSGVGIGDADMVSTTVMSVADMPTDVTFFGSVTFDEADAGQTVDVLAAALFGLAIPIEDISVLYYQLPSAGVVNPWGGDPATLGAYGDPVTIDANELTVSLPVYNGQFNENTLPPGVLLVYYGYRLEDGTVKFGSTPTEVTILP
ncbi:hypothetical protein QUF50_01160 [Thiotrichales bacterium HSG1]|nr:hypothetical protein [Thiotrichales bacterium HSG1]